MRAPSSPETASSTSACTSPASSTPGSASPIPGAERSSPSAGPESPSLMTSEQSTALRLASIFSSEASLAEERARPATERASSIQRLHSGGRWTESLASYDPDSCCWRTSRISLLSTEGEHGERWSGTWSRSGMWARGTVYPLPPLAPRTSAIGSSPLLPTPMARVNSGTEVSGASRTGGPMLAEVLLPTPTSHERTHTPRPVDHGRQLANEIALLPTPRARTDKEHTADGQHWGELRASIETTGATTEPRSNDGKKSPAPLLNPCFVEWMLGLPEGWSDPDCLLSATEFSLRLGYSSAGASSTTSEAA